MNHDEIITCEDALAQVFTYVDNELDARARETIRRHLQTCRGCFSRFEFERRLKARLKDAGREAASPALAERVQRVLEDFQGH